MLLDFKHYIIIHFRNDKKNFENVKLQKLFYLLYINLKRQKPKKKIYKYTIIGIFNDYCLIIEHILASR